jgi:hypothetical protein
MNGLIDCLDPAIQFVVAPPPLARFLATPSKMTENFLV